MQLRAQANHQIPETLADLRKQPNSQSESNRRSRERMKANSQSVGPQTANANFLSEFPNIESGNERKCNYRIVSYRRCICDRSFRQDIFSSALIKFVKLSKSKSKSQIPRFPQAKPELRIRGCALDYLWLDLPFDMCECECEVRAFFNLFVLSFAVYGGDGLVVTVGYYIAIYYNTIYYNTV